MKINFVNKIKYYALFVRKEQKGYRLIKKKRIDISKKNLEFQEHTLKISNESGKNFLNISDYNYTKNLKFYYFISLNGGQLFFHKSNIGNDLTDHLDLIENKEIIKQFASSLTDTPFKINLLWIILGVILGIFGTISIMSFI